MNKITYFCFVFLSMGAFAQNNLTDEFKSSTINRTVELLNENYVFEDVAKKTGKHLQDKLSEGRFKSMTTIDEFAKVLTEEVQSINHDKHMRFRPASNRPSFALGDIGVAGFKEAKMLEGNIAYLDIRMFVDNTNGEAALNEHMKKLADAKAFIVDLRQCRGGNPAMVQYLCSYFIDKKVHLNSLYRRVSNTTAEYWTVPVTGKKLPNVPVYILTSSKTFSAGEEFCYNMQTQKRAKLIGETTGGGANPGGVFTINDQLTVFIPTGTAINPITKKNWEGVGVTPEVQVSADDALQKALELIKSF